MRTKCEKPMLGDVVVDYSWESENILGRSSGIVTYVRPETGLGSGQDLDFVYTKGKKEFVGFNNCFSVFHIDENGIRYWSPSGFDVEPSSSHFNLTYNRHRDGKSSFEIIP